MYVIGTSPLGVPTVLALLEQAKTQESFWNTHHFSPTGAQDLNPSGGLAARHWPLRLGRSLMGRP